MALLLLLGTYIIILVLDLSVLEYIFSVGICCIFKVRKALVMRHGKVLVSNP